MITLNQKIMLASVSIDSGLLQKALEVSDHKSAEALIKDALDVYIRFNNQKQIRELRGKIQWEEPS